MPSGTYPRRSHLDPPRSKSGLKGVVYAAWSPDKPWKVYGRHHGYYVTVGYFRTKREAGAAYNSWALRVYGPDTFLNPIRPTPSHQDE